MGLIAGYLMVDTQDVTALMDAGDHLFEATMALEEDGTRESMDIDKYWDALHFVLTGFSASTPIEGDPLSDAVVGIQVLDEADDADFISFTPTADLPAIIEALRRVDLAAAMAAFVPTADDAADVYPGGIFDTYPAGLAQELAQSLADLIAFYEKAAAAGLHVVVSIV